MFFLCSDAAPRETGPDAKCQTACKPGSVPARFRAGDGHSSGTSVAGRLARPTRAAAAETRLAGAGPGGPAGRPPLCGLAPGGVYPAAPVARGAVRSCRTVSPLPAAGVSRARAVCFLWHCPWGRPRRPLAGTVFPWSPDFPPPRLPAAAAVRPSGASQVSRARARVNARLPDRRRESPAVPAVPSRVRP